ncbi:MAG: hypothetical protein PHW04_14450 [Candidatus Wallbacteria bacterium]|nr:hypothetical protein [Candidatus Wallbacteria bacterium]
MKKYFLTVILVCSFSAMAGPTITLGDNFDLKPLGQPPIGWAAVCDGDGKCGIFSGEYYSAPNCFRIGNLANWDGCYSHALSATGEILVINFKLKGQANVWFRPFFNVTVDGRRYGGSYDAKSGRITWVNGEALVQGSHLNECVWYSVSIIVNRTTATASYYLNDALETVGNSFWTPGAAANGDCIALASGSGGAGVVYYDDLYVYPTCQYDFQSQASVQAGFQAPREYKTTVVIFPWDHQRHEDHHWSWDWRWDDRHDRRDDHHGRH